MRLCVALSPELHGSSPVIWLLFQHYLKDPEMTKYLDVGHQIEI
jgi:hypothetical protein